MTMDTNYLSARGDFRCGICRQKNVFHCEHDTPYRDQYLGMFDENTSRNTLISSRNSKSETRKYDTSISNGGINTGRQVNSNAGAKYQQGKQLDQRNVDNQHANDSSQTHKQNKKSKACVIL